MANHAAEVLSDFKAPTKDLYEFEDPAQAWVGLCEATRLVDPDRRTEAMKIMLNLARNSHWNQDLFDTELELEAAGGEYGGPFPGDEDFPEGSQADTEPYEDFQQDAHALDQSQARTKVTARQAPARATVYCPFCGNWYTALDFVKHTC